MEGILALLVGKGGFENGEEVVGEGLLDRLGETVDGE